MIPNPNPNPNPNWKAALAIAKRDAEEAEMRAQDVLRETKEEAKVAKKAAKELREKADELKHEAMEVDKQRDTCKLKLDESISLLKDKEAQLKEANEAEEAAAKSGDHDAEAMATSKTLKVEREIQP